MASIKHRVGIKAEPGKVFEALSTVEGIKGWWTEEASGKSETGENISLLFATPDGKELGRMRMQVQELREEKSVRWKFLEGPAEWIGTEATFQLKSEDDYTIVLLSHENWREEVEFMAHCSTKWAIFLISLKEFVETGRGRPSPHDIKIDNWN